MRNKSEKIISAITRIMIRIIKTIRSDQNEHKKWSSQLWRPKRLVEPWSALEWWWSVWYTGIFSGNHRHCHRHRHPSHHRHHHHHYLILSLSSFSSSYNFQKWEILISNLRLHVQFPWCQRVTGPLHILFQFLLYFQCFSS